MKAVNDAFAFIRGFEFKLELAISPGQSKGWTQNFPSITRAAGRPLDRPLPLASQEGSRRVTPPLPATTLL